MMNRSDTMHRIRRAKNNVKDLTNGMFIVSIKAPYSMTVLKQELELWKAEIRELEDFAKQMGWKLEG